MAADDTVTTQDAGLDHYTVAALTITATSDTKAYDRTPAFRHSPNLHGTLYDGDTVTWADPGCSPRRMY